MFVSGFFEILGAGLLVPRVRRAASWGLVALYVAVFPANVTMALRDIQPAGVHIPEALLWLRLPLQLVFIALALWVGKPDRAPGGKPGRAPGGTPGGAAPGGTPAGSQPAPTT